MARQSIEPDIKMMTLYIQHEKMFSKVLKRCHGLTTTEFCILRSLCLAADKVDSLDFAKFLLLKRNSISTALNNLVEKNLVSKDASSKDKRMLRVSATEQGKAVAKQATSSIYQAQLDTFWSTIEPEIRRFGNEIAIRVLSKIRGFHCTEMERVESADSTPITPEFVVFCKVVPQTWNQAIKRSSDLSLTDYRILSCIVENQRCSHASDIMNRLLLDRSTVSLSKDFLVSSGLITEVTDEDDKRNSNLKATAKGRRLHKQLHALLVDVTNEMFSECSDEETAAINHWNIELHDRMNVGSNLD